MAALWWGAAFLTAAGVGWRAVPGIGLIVIAMVVRRVTSDSRGGTILVAIMAMVFAVIGAARSPAADPPSLASLVGETAIRGQVVGGVSRANGRQYYRLRSESVATEPGEWTDVTAHLRVSGPSLPEVRSGDRVRLEALVTPLEAHAESYRSYLSRQGIGGTFSARSTVITGARSVVFHPFDAARMRIDTMLQGAVPGDGGALLAGLVTGDDDSLSDRRKDAFLVAGLTHVTAISGSNVALLITVLAGREPNSRRQRKRWLLALVAASIWCYAFVVQLEPPVVRASLVATLALVGVRLGRRPDYITLTMVTAVAMVLIRPEYVRVLGFQLSFVAATALLVVVESDEAGATGASQVLNALKAVTVAHLAIMPLVLPIQQQVSLSAIPANLLVAPLVAITFAMGLVAAAAGLVWLPAGGAVASVAGILSAVILRIVDLFGNPRASIPLWAMSERTLMVIGGLTALFIWGVGSEGRRVGTRWALERREALTKHVDRP